MESSIVLTFEDICSREEWIIPGAIISRNLVHLSIKGYKLAGECVRMAVAWSALKITPLGDPLLDVGEGVLDLLWVQVPHACGGAKRMCSPNTGQRPMKNVIELSQCTANCHLLGLTPTKLDPPKAC